MPAPGFRVREKIGRSLGTRCMIRNEKSFSASDVTALLFVHDVVTSLLIYGNENKT